MQWIPVTSRAISRVAYLNGEIYIDWKEAGGGDIYAYRAPEHIFKQLLAASSIGKFANQIIKQYSARLVGTFV